MQSSSLLHNLFTFTHNTDNRWQASSYALSAKIKHWQFVRASLAGDNTLIKTTPRRVNHQELVISSEQNPKIPYR